ncbi:hypothetical protein M8494_27860 [Serratia ureilytica]
MVIATALGAGVGDLGVGGVGFGRRQIGEGLPCQHVDSLPTPRCCPSKCGRRSRWKPHAVADHQNETFLARLVSASFQPLCSRACAWKGSGDLRRCVSCALSAAPAGTSPAGEQGYGKCAGGLPV